MFYPTRSAAQGFFIASLCLLFVFAFPQTPAAEQALTPDTILKVINQDRQLYGLPPLKTNTKLQRAAQKKAEHMLRHDYFAHTSPDGHHPWDFIKSEVGAYRFAGENLAINYQSEYELEYDLLASPSHRQNLLSPLFSDAGIAVISGQFQGQPATMIVQMFTQPVSEIASAN